MEKQIILFDIDKTLFDVETFFNNNLWPVVEKDLGISRSVLDKISQEYQKTLSKNTQFHPEGWLEVARQEIGEKVDQINELFHNSDFFVKSLFPEVIPMLNELKEDYILGIYSEGVEKWQREKLQFSGINNYFEQKYIFISPDKISVGVLEKLPKGSIVVDDKEDFILELKKLKDIYPVWLNRTGKESIQGVREVRDLTTLLPMIDRIKLENSPQS